MPKKIATKEPIKKAKDIHKDEYITNCNRFKNFFKANQDFMEAHSAMNKAANELIGKKFYSNETKKTWTVINVYEQGKGFKSRYYAIWIEDLSTELKFWTWERLKYGWKHPRMMVPVEVLNEKFEKGVLVAIENGLEIEELLQNANKKIIELVYFLNVNVYILKYN